MVDESTVVLMVQNVHTLFCYYNISQKDVNEFKKKYGEYSLKNSKPVIKIYKVTGGCADELKTVYIDEIADNWYINLDDEDTDIFIKVGRIFPNNTFAAFCVSNTVTTPRGHESSDNSVYYVDTSKLTKNIPYAREAKDSLNGREPKPYPFKKEKKK